ncbi:MAG: RNA methyltransferase [Myxococcota bacterium]|nr:RNA methyltransferase [Myxococcota bacterium]
MTFNTLPRVSDCLKKPGAWTRNERVKRGMMSLHEVELAGRCYDVGDVIEALAPHVTERRIARIDHVLAHRLTTLALGLEDVRHNHNATACLRTAESLGVHDVVSLECPDGYPWPMEEETVLAKKVTMYADRWLDLHRLSTTDQLVQWARHRDMRILGTSPHARFELDDVSVDTPTLVLFGNEGEGLRPATKEVCDDVFKLPMYGFTESFNLSVTVGMTLRSLSTKRRAVLADSDQVGDMAIARQRYLKAQWFFKSVRRADLILARYQQEQHQPS